MKAYVTTYFPFVSRCSYVSFAFSSYISSALPVSIILLSLIEVVVLPGNIVLVRLAICRGTLSELYNDSVYTFTPYVGVANIDSILLTSNVDILITRLLLQSMFS